MSEKLASRIPVIIASSLKSAKDTRAWGKLGFSLRETNKYHLNFIGFSVIKQWDEHDEHFFSSSKSKTTWGRATSQLKFLKTLITVRPKILICCTYEYLPLAGLLKNILNYKLIYDVQENYVANLALNHKLSAAKRSKLSRVIKAFEKAAKVDLYLLAEECYVKEMPEKHPYLVLENKFSGKIKQTNPIQFPLGKNDFRFLISGTLTPTYGILEAIEWFKKVLQKHPESTLQIIGHCTLLSFQKELKKACNSCPEIELFSSEIPLDYTLILAAYQEKDFALLPYQNLPQLWDKMPTKLFEAAAMRLPVLIPNNSSWQEFLKPFSGGYVIDFSKPELAKQQLGEAVKQTYFSKSPDQSILWSSIQSEFIEAVDKL